MEFKIQKDALVALLKAKDELRIAQEQYWYNIPVDSSLTPPSVKDGSLQYIAFERPKIYEENVYSGDGFLISNYSMIKKISIARRADLFPDEPLNEQSDKLFFKIEFSPPVQLPQEKIINRRRRRILFINTTFERLMKAKEINDLFYESPIEEKVWEKLKSFNIDAERQYEESVQVAQYFIDFALFCRNGKIALECNGDAYLSSREAESQFKRRDNLLESSGWHVLRLNSEDIEYRLDETINQVKDIINKYGGLEIPGEPDKYRYITNQNDSRLSLFD